MKIFLLLWALVGALYLFAGCEDGKDPLGTRARTEADHQPHGVSCVWDGETRCERY